MGEHKLKHIEILKTVPEIKESIEELKFGTIIKTTNGWDSEYLTKVRKGEFYKVGSDEFVCGGFMRNKNNWKIIGQIHEGHLRMFFEKIKVPEERLWKYNNKRRDSLEFAERSVKTPILERFLLKEIDNTKPYQEQLEEFFEKLNKWIIKEFKTTESLLNDNIS